MLALHHTKCYDKHYTIVAGDHDILQREVCEHLGLCEDMAAIWGDHGGGPVLWNMDLCSGMGRRHLASPDTMVHHLHFLLQQASWQQACTELCIVVQTYFGGS